MSHSFTITQSFHYDTETAEYVARIQLLFHCGIDEYLPEMFRAQYVIFDSALSAFWGHRSNEGRWRTKELKNDGFEALKKASADHCEHLRATINDIVLNNRFNAKRCKDLVVSETFTV